VSVSRYSILVLLVAITSLAFASVVLAHDPAARNAVLFGAIVATLNTLAAHALVVLTEHRSTRVFLGAVLGGMAGRMALMLAAVVLGVLVLELPRLPLVTSLLGHFGLFLALELSVQHRHFARTAATR
jgi:hypothetical protein